MTTKFAALAIAALAVIILRGQEASTVGYNTGNIQRGENKVEINFKAVNRPFATLGDVLQFDPHENLVGDEVAVSLDGKVWRYAVANFDGTNYVLTTTKGGVSSVASFHSIPWLPVIWINHKSDKPLGVTVDGAVAGEYARIERQKKREENRPSHPTSISVSIVSTNDVARPMNVKLKGGHISLKGE